MPANASDKAKNIAKESVSAVAGAAVGALVGSIIPGLGTLVGAIVGAVIGRVAESAANYILGSDENKQPVAARRATPVAVVNTRGTTTNEMIAKMGGPVAQLSIATQLAEPTVATPKPALGARPIENATVLATHRLDRFPGASMLNSAALPRLTH